ncbi:MAG TPA: diguanylate cyclase [Mycobacteriales bacterium]|nr:diguanylate cyclase [Mycobacteriales bacterium]
MRGRAPAHRAERRWQVRASIGALAVAVVISGGGVAASCARLATTTDERGEWSTQHTLLLVSTTLLLVFALALVVEVDRSWAALTRMHRAAEQELNRQLALTARALTSKERDLAAKERALADQHSHVEALRAERDFTAAVLDKAVALVVVYDHDGRIIGFNSACEQLTGYSEEEVAGRGFWEVLFASEFTPLFAAELERLKSDPTPATVEVAWTDRRNRWRRISFTTTVLHDREGQVTFYVASGTDVTEQRSKEARLRRLADTDPLTGLLNRTAFRRELEGALDPRAGAGAALLFCDLDDFKAVNDTLGHATGDDLLVSVARRLREAVRGHDVVARLGGDEFVILCPGLGAEDTGRLALRVGETVERPHRLDTGEVLVGVSIGTALATAGVDPDTALELADHSMYRTKANRRALAAR